MRIKSDGLELKDIEHLPILEDAYPNKGLKAVERAEIGLFQSMGGRPNPGEVFERIIYVAGRFKYEDVGWNIIASRERNRRTGEVFCETQLSLNFVGSYRVTERY